MKHNVEKSVGVLAKRYEFVVKHYTIIVYKLYYSRCCQWAIMMIGNSEGNELLIMSNTFDQKVACCPLPTPTVVFPFTLCMMFIRFF